MKTKVFPHWLLVVGLFIVGSLAIGPSALAGPALVDPPVYTWTGLGANIGWMAPKNWNPEGRPGSGSELVFPEDAWYEYRTNYNNFSPGKNFSSITLEDSQYTLNGNRVSVEGIYDYGPPRSWGNSGANRINLDLSRKMGTTLLPLHVYVNDSNHTLWVYGTVDRTSDIFKEGAGALWLKGAGNWADEYLFVEAGTLLLDGDLSAPAGTYVGGVYPATDGVLDLRDTLNTGALDVRNSSTVRFNLAPGGLEGYIRTTGRPIFSPNSSLDINVWNDFIPPHSRRFVLIVNGSDQDALGRPKYYGTVYTLAEGETFTPNGPAQRFAITYSGGGGNDVVIMPAARIGVYVKDHLGAPLGGWTVRLRNPNQWNRSATTNSRGYAEFWVYPNNAHDPYVDEYTVCPVLGDGWVQTGVEGGSVEGSCTVFSWDGLTDSELDTAWSQAVTFTNIRKADLAISQGASPDPALRGGDLSYVVSLRSFGPGRPPAGFQSVIDAPARFKSLQAPAGFTCATPEAGATGTVTCTTATIPVSTPENDEPLSTVLVVNIDSTTDATQVTHTATLVSDYDTTAGNNTATASVDIFPGVATVLVDDSYDNDYPAESPPRFRTIQAAQPYLAAGGTMRVYAGTYTGPFDLVGSYTVSTDGDVTLNGNLSLTSGAGLDVATGVLAVNGNVSLAGDSIFTASTGNNTISGDLSVDGAGAAFNVPTGHLTVGGNLTIGSSGGVILAEQATVHIGGSLDTGAGQFAGRFADITLGGDLTDGDVTGPFGFVNGYGTLTLDGTTTLRSGSQWVVVGNLVIQPGATADLTGHVRIRGSLTVDGALNAGTSRVDFSPNPLGQDVTISGSAPIVFHDLEAYTGSDDVSRVVAPPEMTVTGTLLAIPGLDANGGTVIFDGADVWISCGLCTLEDVRIASGSKLTLASTSEFQILGDLTDQGAFVATTGSTLRFAGTGGQQTFSVSSGDVSLSTLDLANPAGLTLGLGQNQILTVRNELDLGGNLIVPSSTYLALAPGSISSGTADVVGRVGRTTGLVAGQAYAFGNPNVSVAFEGTPPATFFVDLAKSTPSGLVGAAARNYTVVSSGAFNATVRLHYLDGELAGNDESQLQVWTSDGTGWVLAGRTGGDTDANWVEATAGGATYQYWALATGPRATTTTVDWAPPALFYGDAITLTATVQPAAGSGTPTGSVSFGIDGTSLGSVTLVDGVASLSLPAQFLGDHPITAAFDSDGSLFTDSSGSATLTVYKALLAVWADDQSKDYGAPLPDLTVTYSGFVAGDDESVLTGAPDLSTTATANSLPGTYPITVMAGTLSAPGYYELAFMDGTLTVDKADSTVLITGVTPETKTYGQEVTITAAVVPAYPEAGVPTGSVSVDDAGTELGSAPLVNGVATLTIAGLSAGNHDVRALYNGDDNYNGAWSNVSFWVNKALLTVTADDKTKSYGADVPALTVSYSGFVLGEDQSVLSGTPLVSTEAYDYSPVGTYPIVVERGNLDSSNYEFTFVNGTLTVVRADTDTVLIVPPSPPTYGDVATLEARVHPVPGPGPVAPSGSVVFFDGATSLGSAALNLGGIATLSVSSLGAGAHTLSAGYAGDGSFAGSTSGPVALTVDLRPVTVMADPQTKNVGQPDPALTYQITSGSLVGSDGFTGELTRQVGETPGTYPILQGTLSLDSNYALTYVGADLTIVSKLDQTITFADILDNTYGAPDFEVSASASSGLPVSFSASGNCTISGNTVTITSAGSCSVTASQEGNDSYNPAEPVSQSFAIAKAAATLMLSDLDQVYDGTAKSATVTTSPDGLTGVSITYDGSATQPVNAGSYAVVATLDNPNYQADNGTGTLIIAKANQTITFGALADKTYGDADFTVSATASPGLPVSFSVGAGDACTISGNTVHIAGAGSCTVTATQGGNENYNAALPVSQTFAIAKKAASVTPDAASKTYGADDPILTGILEGFLEGDNVTASYSRMAGEGVGVYTISAALSPAEVLSNYDITYNTADFTITPRNVTLTADAGGPYLVAVGNTTPLDGSGSNDPGGYPLTFEWSATGGTVSGSGSGPTFTAGSTAGVFEVSLTVTSPDGLSATATAMMVVYDPNGGYVTGGGWIDSPEGACPLGSICEGATGKATFGFVSKYKKGANVPTGNTEFQFQAGGLNFHSETYEWLVVNQGGTNAQFKGSGTVNGGLDPNGNAYKFMLWAGDGSPDTFGIRIWWEDEFGAEHDVYDNGVDQEIGGGSIVVHKGK